MSATFPAGLRLLVEHGLDGLDIRVLLLDDAAPYVFDATHLTVADVLSVTAESAGPGYTRKQVTNAAAAADGLLNEVRVDADPVIVEGADFGTVQAALVYVWQGPDTSSVPLALIDSAADLPTLTDGTDLEVAFPDGVLVL